MTFGIMTPDSKSYLMLVVMLSASFFIVMPNVVILSVATATNEAPVFSSWPVTSVAAKRKSRTCTTNSKLVQKPAGTSPPGDDSLKAGLSCH